MTNPETTPATTTETTEEPPKKRFKVGPPSIINGLKAYLFGVARDGDEDVGCPQLRVQTVEFDHERSIVRLAHVFSNPGPGDERQASYRRRLKEKLMELAPERELAILLLRRDGQRVARIPVQFSEARAEFGRLDTSDENHWRDVCALVGCHIGELEWLPDHGPMAKEFYPRDPMFSLGLLQPDSRSTRVPLLGVDAVFSCELEEGDSVAYTADLFVSSPERADVEHLVNEGAEGAKGEPGYLGSCVVVVPIPELLKADDPSERGKMIASLARDRAAMDVWDLARSGHLQPVGGTDPTK